MLVAHQKTLHMVKEALYSNRHEILCKVTVKLAYVSC
jgi:hypothetical protein